MDFEKEWYEHVRNGWTPLCDRCNDEINKDEYDSNRNERGIYCEKCWNWIHIQKFKCIVRGCKKSIRSEKLLPFECCGELMLCLSR